MSEEYSKHYYRGILSKDAVRSFEREIPEGNYLITSGETSRMISRDKIRTEITRREWGELKGTIRGPIKLERAEK